MATGWHLPTTDRKETPVEFDPIDRLLLRRLNLTEAEALLVCEVLKTVNRGPECAKLLWGDVEDAVISGYIERKPEVDTEDLTARLQKLNDGEAVALLRGVQWFWRDSALPAQTRLQQIGLTPSS
jgi:hypothetical protein